MKLISAAVVLLAAGPCALPQVVPEAQGEFTAAGEVQFYSRSASFDSSRVRSTRMNLAKRTDGSWAGTFLDQPVDVSVTPDKIRGVNLTISLEDVGDKGFLITGQWQGRILRYELRPEMFIARTPNQSVSLNRKTENSYGPNGELELRGQANDEPLHWPQMAFALMSVFNG